VQRRRAPEEPCLRHGDEYDTSPQNGVAQHWIYDSYSPAQKGCDYARIATTVKYGQDKEWFFIRCVHDQKIP
jgi:hypothetical protein